MENPHVANNARILAAEKSERQASTGAPADGRLNALEARLNRIEAALSDTVRWDEQLGKFVAQCLKEAGVQNISARIDALEARPGIKYLGTFREGRVYDEGSLTTFDGSVWHANQRTTTPPGNGAAAWTLCVKHGERGRDGMDFTK